MNKDNYNFILANPNIDPSIRCKKNCKSQKNRTEVQ